MAEFNFNDMFMNNPALQYGLNLLGSRGTANPYASAQTAMQKMQEMQQAQVLQQAQAAELLSQRDKQTADAEKQKQINKLLEQAIREYTGGQTASRTPTPQAPLQEDMGPQGQGMQPPQGYNWQGQSVNPFNGFATPGVNRIGAQPMQAQLQMQANTDEILPALPPAAFAFSLAGLKDTADLLERTQGWKIGPTGIASGHTRGGGIGPVPGSLKMLKEVKEMEEAVKAQFDETTITLPDGSKAEVSKLEKSVFTRTGQLPQRILNELSGEASQQPAAAPTATPGNLPVAGQAYAPAVPGNNYGNMRPAGASKGFQSFTSPEAGIAAIDKQLQIYGSRGINTLSKIISTWAPPNENATASLITNAAKRLGISADQPLDMNNPATRHLVSSAIMLQEHGAKALLAPAQAPAAPANVPSSGSGVGIIPSPQAQAQLTQTSETWGKYNMGAQEASITAGGKLNHIAALESQLDKIPRTGWNAQTELGWNKLISAFGFKPAKFASHIEAAQALSKQLAMEMRDPKDGGGSPGQISNFETRLFNLMVASPDKLKATNKILIDAYRRKQQRKVDVAKVYSSYAKMHRGMVDQGVMEQVEKLIAAKPLFSAEEARTIENETLGTTGTGNQSGSGPENAVGGRIKGLPTSNPLDKFWSQ